jgi:hypothetical protein
MSQMFLNVVSTFKGDGIQQATRQLGAFGKQTSSFGSILGKVGGALAAFGVATKAVKFGRETITAARDLERNLFALDTIFGDLAPQMRQFAKNAENMGLSESKAAKASTFLGSVLKQSGFEMGDVVEKSQQLVNLGTDLAATYGYDVQEALLGMTALFRGEYDPIEKFGVAMKQAEVNAVLAERGLDKLTGAQLRNAEQTVRYEILIERSADALGAFAAQSGSLFTEQKKLGASFENMQAQLGTALLPAITGVNRELRKMLKEATPGLVEIFGVLADGLEALLGIFRDAMDPTTELGESFTAMGIQFNSLWNTIFGKDFNIAQIFEAGAFALGIFIDLVHDLLRFVENTIIIMQVLGEQMHALITLDWDKFFGTNWNAEIKNRMDLTSATKDFKLQSETATQSVKDLRDSVADADKAKLENLKTQLYGIRISAGESAAEMRRFRQQAGLPAIGKKVETGTATGGGGGGGGGGSAAVEKEVLGPIEQLNKTLNLSQKQAVKQTQLLGLNLKQGVVDNILSMSKPVVAANTFIKSVTKKNGEISKKGIAEVSRLNALYDAGIEQVNQRASEAAAAANAAAEEARRQAEELRRAEEARIEGLNQLYANFLDTIKGTFAGIRNAITGAFDITGLGGSTNAIIRNMNKLLAKMKSFSANVKSLATMGLDPALLQQVIQAGPVAGSRIAAALVSGGAGALASINAGFGEVGSLASEIAETGVRSLFDTKAQQNQYNITVTGGVGSGATIGKAIVDAIKDYERTSGAVWQGA